MAAVSIADKWGYIDHQGEFVVEPQFEDAFPFSAGRAMVQTEDGYKHINLFGEFID